MSDFPAASAALCNPPEIDMCAPSITIQQLQIETKRRNGPVFATGLATTVWFTARK
jgi:hypothetical protein